MNFEEKDSGSILIIPAILSSNEEEFFSLVKTASSFAKRIQLDFMDGKFVPSKSVPVESALSLKDLIEIEEVHLEAHLMVKTPEKYFEVLSKSGVKTVIFHFEAVNNAIETLESSRKFGFETGLAVNPETEIEKFESYVYDFDFIMFMTVKPGYYGSPLEIEALEKMGRFHRLFPDIVIAVDGGVKKDNLSIFVEKGASRICVGSAIMKAESPKEAFLEFKKILTEKGGI